MLPVAGGLITRISQSLEAAKRVLEYGLEGVYPTGFLRYVTEVCRSITECA